MIWQNEQEMYLNETHRIDSSFGNFFMIIEVKGNGYHIFFDKPKTVNYLNIQETQNLVFSTIQIDEFMEKNLIDDLSLELNGSIINYSCQKFEIGFIEDTVLNFNVIKTFVGEKFQIF